MPLVLFPEPGLAADHSAFDSTTAPEAEDTQNGSEVYGSSENEEGSALEVEVVHEPPPKSTQVEAVTVMGSAFEATQEEKKSYASIVCLFLICYCHDLFFGQGLGLGWLFF